MTQISKRTPVKSSARWAVSLAIVALLYTPASPGFWSGVGWAKERREVPYAPAAGQPPSPDPVPAALPVREPPGALGTALASCDKGPENSEPLTLPGARGEVKLDRCYRGRDHLVCSFNALLKEAMSLVEDYAKIVEARYPEVSNVEAGQPWYRSAECDRVHQSVQVSENRIRRPHQLRQQDRAIATRRDLARYGSSARHPEIDDRLDRGGR